MRSWRIAAGLLWAIALFFVSPANAADALTVHLFWAENCPHCAAEKMFLPELANQFPGLSIVDYEVSENRGNAMLLREVGRELEVDIAGVPVTIVGRRHVIGYRDATSTGKTIEQMVRLARDAGDEDVVARIASGMRTAESDASGEVRNDVADVQAAGETGARGQVAVTPDEIDVFGFGKVKLSEVSLPVFTVTMAFLDGFNPCAMWVLLFLLSLLVGVPDRRRAWTLGSAFMLASGLMYFLFLSAWLNIFLFMGFVSWVRISVGILSLAVGLYYLQDYIRNRNGGCGVVSDGVRDRVFSLARAAVGRSSLLFGVIGVMALAVAVNLIELVCSAGLPAVFTHVLSSSDLPVWQYYAYLALYVVIFMIDDMFIFVVALSFLQLTGIQHKYTRCVRIIGGALMLAIGLALLFKPEFLTLG